MKNINGKSSLIRTDTFWYKIKKMFTNLFGIKSSKSEQIVKNSIENVETSRDVQDEKKSIFIEQLKIKCEDENEAKKAIKLLKAKKIKVEELTEEQKKEVMLLLEDELINLKNRILYNKLKCTEDKISILNRVSEKDKITFLEFVKQKSLELNAKIVKSSNT